MDSHRRIERTAADWLARRSDRGRTWSSEDQAALDQWLSASAAHQVAYIRLETIWRQADRIKALGAGVPRGVVLDKAQRRDSPFFTHLPIGHTAAPKYRPPPQADNHAATPPRELASLQFRPALRPVRRRRLRAAGTAAGVLLACMLSILGWRWYAAPLGQADFRTAFGEVQQVALPDGSTATLSGDTRLRSTLLRSARRVELAQGEAFFQVARDPRRPFSVQVGAGTVTAVGTRFAVRGEAGTDAMRVVVTEGTVRLDTGGRAQPAVRSVLLAAGAIATVRGGAVRVESRSPEQAEQALAWRTGEVVFSGTPLSEAVAEFNRYNTRRIVIDDPALAQMRVDGGFRTTNVDGFVRLLEVAFDVRAERNDDRIVLRRR